MFSCSKKIPIPDFDAEKAWSHLIAQCDFGARTPGSKAHGDCLVYISNELQKVGAKVSLQRFSEKLPFNPEPVSCANIIASFGEKKRRRILLCAHWDTRPWADQDAVALNRSKPVPGANDGASGVAVLLEVARHLNKVEPQYGVNIIFFDAEDSGQPNQTDFALGSRYFAKHKSPNYHPEFGILLDMVGDADLQVYQEVNSVKYAKRFVDRVWQKAAELNLPSFRKTARFQVEDDHIPLLESGIPCIDLIDFDYPYWHSTEDTPDKCSPQSLGEVGQLILNLLYAEG